MATFPTEPARPSVFGGSRGGVVETGDLCRSLAEQFESAELGALAQRLPQGAAGEHDLPLANSPQLRRALFAALAIAEFQAETSPTISSATLLAALAAVALPGDLATAIAARLGLSLPPAIVTARCSERPPPTITSSTSPTEPAAPRPTTVSALARPPVKQIVARWLAAHALPAGSERAKVLSELGELANLY